MKIARVPQNITVFRGTQSDYYDEWEVGNNYEIPIYFSTSLKSSITKEFIDEFAENGNELLIEILVPKNAKGFYLGDHTSLFNEFELILNRNTVCKVLEKADKYMKLLVEK